MPKSKVNNKRKGKINNFKNKQKKMSKKPEFKPFNQVPYWDPNATFEITAREFEVLKNFCAIFSEPLEAMKGIFMRHMQNETIKVRYEDLEGKEVPKEEIEAQMKLFQEASAVAEPVPDEAATAE